MKIKTIRRQSQAAKAGLCLFVFLAVLLSFVLSGAMSKVFAAPAIVFSDVAPDAWYSAAVSRAKGEGILDGYPDGSFRPDGVVTYAEFLRMAVGNAPPPSTGHWAAGYYEEGIKRELFTQREIRPGSLDQPISRKYMALVFAGLLKDRDFIPLTGFFDIDPRSAFEYYIAKSAAAGLLIGYPDHTFRPDSFLTRAEAATAFVRLSDIAAADKQEEAVPVEDMGGETEQPSIEDVMEPEYKAYLDEILQSLRVWGSNGKYQYRFEIPDEIEGSKVYFKVAFYSPFGASALPNEKFISKDARSRTVEDYIDGLNTLSQIGTASFNFSIASLDSENWHHYLVRWKSGNFISLRIQCLEKYTNRVVEEYSTDALDYAFSWQ
jgi:hypothetical protein